MHCYAPLLGPMTPLPDRRLRRRLRRLLDALTDQPNCTIPQATANRNDMDGAYALFANTARVTPTAIVASCLPETLARLDDGPRILALQDTTELNFAGLKATTGLGYTAGTSVRGLLLHSSLAVRPDGLPVGLLTQQFWARDPAEKGRTRDRRQRAAADKESFRWLDHARAARAVLPADRTVVHIADREADIYDWLAAPRPAHAHLLVRVAQAHRVVVHGPQGAEGRLAEVVRAQAPCGTYELQVPRADDRPSRRAVLTLRVASVAVLPPRHAKRRGELPSVPVWVIEAWEEDPPTGEKALCWRLVTTEPVPTRAEAIRALEEYVLRWRIERFHYVLKVGCLVEQLQLETAGRLANAVAVYSQVAVQLLRLTYRARQEPEAAVESEFTAEEVTVLTGCRQQQQRRSGLGVRTLAEAVRVVARLGGHLGRKGDGPAGVKVLWRGLRRLHDQVLGYRLAQSHGNQDVRNE
jgi:hypothetical protein